MFPSASWKRSLLVVGALSASFVAGFSIGRQGPVDGVASPGEGRRLASAPAPGAPASRSNAPDIARPASVGDLIDDPRVRAAAIASVSGDPLETARAVSDSMSDRELIALVSSTTSLPERELDGLRDVRGFALRLSEIAVDGVLKARSEDGGEVAAVSFADSVDASNRPVFVRSRFTPGTERIYAVFDTDDYTLGDVMVKWYRTDPPEMLLFGRYPIRRGEGQSHVWFERPHGWAEGDYRVEFYSGDPALVKLASGSYAIDGDADR